MDWGLWTQDNQGRTRHTWNQINTINGKQKLAHGAHGEQKDNTDSPEPWQIYYNIQKNYLFKLLIIRRITAHKYNWNLFQMIIYIMAVSQLEKRFSGSYSGNLNKHTLLIHKYYELKKPLLMYLWMAASDRAM